jgi:ribosomal protein L11 methylase PrmA
VKVADVFDAMTSARVYKPSCSPLVARDEIVAGAGSQFDPQVVDAMLKLANVGKGDVLFDLGSGDGRIPVTAAKRFGIRAVGIDIDPQRIAEANENAKKNKVTDLVQFRNEDMFLTDIHDASVVTLYLLPELNVKLRPRLWSELKPGTRIVSHQFDMGDWKADKKLESSGRVIYFWLIPDQKKGR